MSKKIAIIGGGNLGTAIAEGLINSGFCPAPGITITKRNLSTLNRLKEMGVKVTSNNHLAVEEADIVILAIKPFQTAELLASIRNSFDEKKHLLVSVVTGITISEMKEAIGKKIAIVRAMPNTAIAIQESMTCLAGMETTTEQKDFVSELFNRLGKSVWIDEKIDGGSHGIGCLRNSLCHEVYQS